MATKAPARHRNFMGFIVFRSSLRVSCFRSSHQSCCFEHPSIQRSLVVQTYIRTRNRSGHEI